MITERQERLRNMIRCVLANPNSKVNWPLNLFAARKFRELITSVWFMARDLLDIAADNALPETFTTRFIQSSASD